MGITIYTHPTGRDHVANSEERLTEAARAMYGPDAVTRVKVRESVPPDVYLIVYDGIAA